MIQRWARQAMGYPPQLVHPLAFLSTLARILSLFEPYWGLFDLQIKQSRPLFSTLNRPIALSAMRFSV